MLADTHAEARDRKRRARSRMGVSGRSVFVIERMQREQRVRPQRVSKIMVNKEEDADERR